MAVISALKVLLGLAVLACKAAASMSPPPGLVLIQVSAQEKSARRGGLQARQAQQQQLRTAAAAAEAEGEAEMDGSFSRKKGFAYRTTGMGNSGNNGSDTPKPNVTGVEPIRPSPETVRENAGMGTARIAVEPKSEMHRKLTLLARTVHTVAYHDRMDENSSAAVKYDAMRRMTLAESFSTKLGEGKVRAVDVMDLAAHAFRRQSAASLLENGALLTATDFSFFVGLFRGEDYGTHFDHDTNERFLVSVQGDIVGSRHEYYSAEDTFNNAPGRIWPNGVINYCYAEDTSPRVRDVFEAVTEHYKAVAPFLEFVEVDLLSGTASSDSWDLHRCGAEHAIVVTSDENLGCFSSLGMKDESTQQLNVHDPGCALFGTVAHELGHALGMAHEHPRKEEDYMEDSNMQHYMAKRNIREGRFGYFSLDDSAFRLESHVLGKEEVERMTKLLYPDNPSALVLDSDPLSIMHFDAYAFSNGAPCPVNPYRRHPSIRDADLEKMGQRLALSQSDALHLFRLYAQTTATTEVPTFGEIGCLDGHEGTFKPGESNHMCSSLNSIVPWCSPKAYVHCCGCGGGVQVQCTKEEDCPTGGVHFQAYYWREELIIIMGLVGLSALAVSYLKQKPFPARDWPAIPVSFACYLAPQESKPGSSAPAAAKEEPVSPPYVEEESPSEVSETAKPPEARKKSTFGSFVERASGVVGIAIGSGRSAAKASDASAPKEGRGKKEFKALANWTQAPVTGSFAEHAAPTTKKLSHEAIARFNKDFAALGGGFSSGRNPPAAPLIGGEDNVSRSSAWNNFKVGGGGPSGAAQSSEQGAAAGANGEEGNAVSQYRMHASDSSDQEHRHSDPFEREIEGQGATTDWTSDDEMYERYQPTRDH